MKKPLFRQGIVEDVDDPLNLGRIRVTRTDDDKSALLFTINNRQAETIDKADMWTIKDPFVFTPLFPIFLYQTPKKDEMVFVLFFNEDTNYLNQFYIQAIFSSPTYMRGEYWVGSQKNTGLGVDYKSPVPINKSTGVFPLPSENALLGRNSADLIIKENDLIIRAGKINGNMVPNEQPVGNTNRSFIQLSRLDNLIVKDKIVKTKKIINQVLMVNYLIEYDVFPKSNGLFDGKVILYQLIENEKVNSENLKIDSQIDLYKVEKYSDSFQNLTSNDSVRFINKFIENCNNSSTLGGKTIFSNEQKKFPIYFRPSNNFYNQYIIPNSTSSNVANALKLYDIFNLVKLNYSTLQRGYGLIYTKDKVGIPATIVEEKKQLFKSGEGPVTVNIIGSDTIYLLSHKTYIPGKGAINLENTLSGISDTVIGNEIEPKTSSLVRGEELLEFISLIVRFLLTHTHAYPGRKPEEITEDGSDAQNIWRELYLAYTKVLNNNIRLN